MTSQARLPIADDRETDLAAQANRLLDQIEDSARTIVAHGGAAALASRIDKVISQAATEIPARRPSAPVEPPAAAASPATNAVAGFNDIDRAIALANAAQLIRGLGKRARLDETKRQLETARAVILEELAKLRKGRT